MSQAERIKQLYEEAAQDFEKIKACGTEYIEGVPMYSFTYRDRECFILSSLWDEKRMQIHLCGYVKVDEIDEADITLDSSIRVGDNWFIAHKLSVHGGITHVNAEKNEIGFDCAHLHDISMPTSFAPEYASYKNLDYVIKELQQLVDILLEEPAVAEEPEQLVMYMIATPDSEPGSMLFVDAYLQESLAYEALASFDEGHYVVEYNATLERP